MKTISWQEVRKGSKITLRKDRTLNGMNAEPRILKAGTYYINGFWADICGLSFKKPNGTNDVCILSTELPAFEEVSN